ncbi:MAG: glycosyltransferase family 87 protein [Anaerolineae bacterium]
MFKGPALRRLNRSEIRIVLYSILVIGAIAILVSQIGRSGLKLLAPHWSLDFQQYWGAARVLLAGDNPYDAVTLANMEATSGIVQERVRMWNPPYTLVLALPYAVLPFGLAALAWLATSALVAIACGAALWRLFGPRVDQRYWLGMIIAIAYLPTLQTLQMGQISAWLLAGITGFLFALRTRRDTLAGAALVFVAIKPHVSFLFLFAAVWWIVRERRWRVLLGASAAMAVACAIVGFISPAVFGQYLRATGELPLYWRTATLGTWLRTVFGAEQYWLQFAPSIVGLILFVIWMIYHKRSWDWCRQAPVLLLASTVCTAYGWGYDQMTLLPVVALLLASFSSLPSLHRMLLVAVYMLAQLGLLLQTQLMVDSSVTYWHPLVLVGLYVWQQRITNKSSQSEGR